MNLLAPIATSTIATVAAVLAGLLVIAYILKMRRRHFEVPFSTLWQRVLKEKEATSLWRHLKRLLSLLLLVAIVGLLLVAALEPEFGGAREESRAVVIIVDASASMKTIDEGDEGKDSRLDAAIEQVGLLLDGMSAGDAIMIMRMDGRATPLSRFHGDLAKHRKALSTIKASDTPASLTTSLGAAADALRWRKNPLIILVGDGAYPEDALASATWNGSEETPSSEGTPSFVHKELATVDLEGIDVRYQPVGQATDNVGIISFNVRRYISNKLNYEVFIEIQNFSKEPVTRRLVLFSGDSEINVKELQLAPGQKITKIYPDLGGGDDSVLRAQIETIDDGASDAFALDDEAWALMPENKRQTVLLVSEDNLYMEGALLIFEHLDVDKLTPAEYETALTSGELPTYDAAIYHGYAPENVVPAPTHLLYFKPFGPHSPFPIHGTLERGRITQVSQTHPVTRWLEMDDVNFDVLDTFSVDTSAAEVALFKSIRSPVAAAKKEGRRKVAAFGFGLQGTDIMLRVAFPLLMVNTLDWFAGADSDLITTYTTGRPARVPLDGTYGISEVAVTTPSGAQQKAPLREGYATFFAAEVGVHKLVAMQGGEEVAEIQVAANLSNAFESDIEPSAELLLAGQKLERPVPGTATPRQSLWIYLCLMVLLLLLVEWYTFNRRITV
ncbi:MAG: VWA domain-containing protein [Myxococcales bacterium]|nr:VWA domain-containing protein [Myxococcales bacterium]